MSFIIFCRPFGLAITISLAMQARLLLLVSKGPLKPFVYPFGLAKDILGVRDLPYVVVAYRYSHIKCIRLK